MSGEEQKAIDDGLGRFSFVLAFYKTLYLPAEEDQSQCFTFFSCQLIIRSMRSFEAPKTDSVVKGYQSSQKYSRIHLNKAVYFSCHHESVDNINRA